MIDGAWLYSPSMRLAQLIGPELETLIAESPEEVRALLDDVHPEDLRDMVDELSDERLGVMLKVLPADYAAQVFERLNEERQALIAGVMGVETTAELAIEMDADERADFFSLIPSAMSEPLLRTLEEAHPEVVLDVEDLTRWPAATAGGLMTTDYVSVPPHLQVRDVVAEVRRSADDAETVDAVWVVEGGERVVGVLTLKRLLIAEPGENIDDVMYRNIISVPPDLDQEDVARKLAKYDLNAIPVVDDTGKLLGVITADDILDVLTEEQSEDVHKMGAVGPLEAGYFDTSFRVFIQKRAPWLLVLFGGGFLTTQTMQAYDGVLAGVAQLSVYVPLLISAGGNSGAQSSTLVIRGLAVGDLKASSWLRVLWRESLQGLTLGTLLALLGGARALLAGDGQSFALLIAITIVSIVFLGCVIGAMMPIVLHQLGIDPATSSTPFIATLIDVLGILIYLTLAQWLLMEAMSAGAGALSGAS